MDFFRVLAIVTGAVLTAGVLPAQQHGGTAPSPTGGGGAGNPTGPGGGTTTQPNTGTIGGQDRTNTTQPFPSETSHPIFLTGKVVLDDGTALAESVEIQRVCNGVPHLEAHTDGKGRFSFQLGQNRELSMDLSDPGSSNIRSSLDNPNSQGAVRTLDLVGCEIQASLPGYRSDTISLFNHRYLDNPDIGTIVLHRLGNVEGLTTSAISARAPKDALKAYEKGLSAARKNKDDEAKAQFEKAASLYPQYATAWFELGKVHEKDNHVDEARKAYTQAIGADAKFINPYEHMYMLAFKEAKWQELADTTERVIHLNPYDFPGAYYFNGVANLQLDKLDTAEKSAREAVNMDKGHRNPKTSYVLGLILARKREFAESAQFLKAYLTAAPNAPDGDFVRKQLGQVESLLESSSKAAAEQR